MLTLQQRNQLFLKEQLSRFDPKTFLTESTQAEAPSENDILLSKGDVSIDDLIRAHNWCLLHPQMFPSETGVKNFSNALHRFRPDGGASQYIGATECDPHMMWSLIRLRQIEEEIGANPDQQKTCLNFRPSLLLSLGTGDGKLLKELVATLKPYHLCIAIRDPKDLESSFDLIDWCAWWNERCESARDKISILPYQSVEELRSSIITHALVSSEHAIVVVPGKTTSDHYLLDRKQLGGHELEVAITYLGFTMDEYNMLWNATQALSRSPRVFRVPRQKPGGKYIVCGSGPSLDDSIDCLVELSSDWTIVACASNYRTLRSAGIDVDILCLLERGSYEYENYSSIKDEYGFGNTKLFCSVTCDERLHELFNDTMVFFRPALTPLSVFSTHPDQVLNFEGPQTVNTGIALCASLGAEEVILVGVDLGTASLDKARSAKAVGVSDRILNIQTKGNLQDLVYTNSLLADGRLAMERCIRSSPSMTVYNSSNGVYIEGAEPRQLQTFLRTTDSQMASQSASHAWRKWWLHHTLFNPVELKNYWAASRPRAHVSNTLHLVRSLLASADPWFPTVQDRLHELLRLDVPIQEQVGRRLCRAPLLKLAIVISRQCYVLLAQDSTGSLQQQFLERSRRLMIELCDQLESEIYDLFDRIDQKLATTQKSPV